MVSAEVVALVQALGQVRYLQVDPWRRTLWCSRCYRFSCTEDLRADPIPSRDISARGQWVASEGASEQGVLEA